MHPIFEKLSRSVAAAIEGADAQHLAYSPAPGVWSCALVLEHLSRSYTGTTLGLERVLKADAPLASPLAPKWRLVQFWVVSLGRFPEGRKSPAGVEPRGHSLEDMPRTYFAELARMDAQLSACERRFGAHRKLLDHPVLHALSVAQWRRFHLVHGQHHVKQLRARRRMAVAAAAGLGPAITARAPCLHRRSASAR